MRRQHDRVMRELHFLSMMARANAAHARAHDAPGVADNDEAIARIVDEAAADLVRKLKERLS